MTLQHPTDKLDGYQIDKNWPGMYSDRFVKNFQSIVYSFYRLFAIVLRPKFIKRETISNPGQAMIIANHISMLDAFMVIASFSRKEAVQLTPIRTITRNKYLFWQPYGHLLRMNGCFPAKPKKGMLHGLDAAQRFAETCSLFFFPQGKISDPADRHQLRSGAAVVANEREIPLIPVFIKKDGLRYVVVRGESFKADGDDIESIMAKVWELEKYV